MKNITYLDMMTESVSAMSAVIRFFKNNADDRKAVDLSTEPYLVVAYSCDTFRKLFDNAPDAIKESVTDEVTNAMSELYMHRCESEEGVMPSSGVRYNLRLLSDHTHVLHMWAHELYQEAHTAVSRWS